jgi:hypothetical protein
VVVAAGFTACTPPLGCKVYVLPSEPVNVTCVAFVAITVKLDELPEEIEAGFAAMLTVGAAAATTMMVAVAEVFPPAPVAVAV